MWCQPRRVQAGDIHELRGVPSGLVVSKTRAPSKPRTRATVSASSRMVTSSPVPMLMSGGASSTEQRAEAGFVEVHQEAQAWARSSE